MPTLYFTPDPNKPKGLSPSEKARIDALTPEEIEENARTDPDNPPSSEEELERGVFGRDVRLLRQGLGLSQSEFARQFQINLRRLQDWEQGRVHPDSVTLAYLKLIPREPETVRRVLGAETAPVA